MYIHIYTYSYMHIYSYIYIYYPSDPVNHAKFLRSSPTDMPLGSWYLSGTKHFRLTIVVRQK